MESPDFEQIAKHVLSNGYERLLKSGPDYPPGIVLDAIAKGLRQVWNARGAADIEAAFRGTKTMAIKNQSDLTIAIAIKKLDR